MAMNYEGAGAGVGTAKQNVVPAQPTISNQAAALLERLDRVIDTSRAITDRLLGPRPREASINQKAAGNEISPSIERLLDLAHNRMSEIEEELTRTHCGI